MIIVVNARNTDFFFYSMGECKRRETIIFSVIRGIEAKIATNFNFFHVHNSKDNKY